MAVIPFIEYISVPRGDRVVEIGQAVSLSILITDVTTSPGQRIPFTPDALPYIEIYNPDHTIKVSFTVMTATTDVGYYNYIHQTTLGGTFTSIFDPAVFDATVFSTGTNLVNADQLGIYTARFYCSNAGLISLTDKMVVFEVRQL